MKKIIILLLTLAASMPVLAQIERDDSPKTAQDNLNEKFLSLLISGSSGHVNLLIDNMPICPREGSVLKKREVPEYCTVSMHVQGGGDSFMSERENAYLYDARSKQHYEISVFIDDGKKISEKPVPLNVASPAKALYYALTKSYLMQFEESPAHLNVENYVAFYKRFSNTSLADLVEVTQIVLWQNSTYVHDGMALVKMDGKKLFDTIDLAARMGVKDPYRYAKGKFTLKMGKQHLVRQIQHVYDGLYTRSVEKNDKKIFHTVKTLWWNRILNTPDVDSPAHAGYNKHWDVINLLADFDPLSYDKVTWESWKTLTIAPITDWQRGRVKALLAECNADQKSVKNGLCIGLKAKAVQYGYITQSDKEVEDHVMKTLNKTKLLAL